MAVLKKLHKWLGLLVGAQVLLWLLSGLTISLIDPAKVSGRQWAAPELEKPVEAYTGALIEPGSLTPEHMDAVFSIRLNLSNRPPMYHLRHTKGETLINAIDGSVITTSQAEAEELARMDFIGDGEITSIEAGMAPNLETRDSVGAYWKVNFSDSANSSLYVSSSSGKILARRNDYWRVRDFFWMLHIMDYQGRKDFNNALIIIVALTALWIGVSGFMLLFGSFGRSDFYFLNILRKREMAIVTLIDPALSTPRQLKLRKGSNLFVSLATHDVSLPSICGGGGECGKCKVQIEAASLPVATAIEQGLIPARMRERGFRLACQHEVHDDLTLRLSAGILSAPEKFTELKHGS